MEYFSTAGVLPCRTPLKYHMQLRGVTAGILGYRQFIEKINWRRR
jgi:hypothetical protein